MSRFNVMPRAYRRQLQQQDTNRVAEITHTQADQLPTGSAGILRGIPAIGKGCPGHIRNTDPLGALERRSVR